MMGSFPSWKPKGQIWLNWNSQDYELRSTSAPSDDRSWWQRKWADEFIPAHKSQVTAGSRDSLFLFSFSIFSCRWTKLVNSFLLLLLSTLIPPSTKLFFSLLFSRRELPALIISLVVLRMPPIPGKKKISKKKITATTKEKETREGEGDQEEKPQKEKELPWHPCKFWV